MTPEAIKSAVELAIQGKLTLLWWTYFFAFFATILAAFIGGYIKVKAANFATKEDFMVALSQLKSQEQVKAEVSHSSWKIKEWNATRLAKLEELVNCAFDLRRLAQNDAEKLGRNLEAIESIIFDRESESLLKLEMLSSLYFPELLSESLELNINFRKFQGEVLKSNYAAQKFLAREKENKLTQADLELLMHMKSDTVSPLNSQITQLHQKFSQSVNSLSSKAKSLLEEIMGI
jgi:hypothetical protein